jgi:hypothetical protein
MQQGCVNMTSQAAAATHAARMCVHTKGGMVKVWPQVCGPGGSRSVRHSMSQHYAWHTRHHSTAQHSTAQHITSHHSTAQHSTGGSCSCCCHMPRPHWPLPPFSPVAQQVEVHRSTSSTPTHPTAATASPSLYPLKLPSPHCW